MNIQLPSRQFRPGNNIVLALCLFLFSLTLHAQVSTFTVPVNNDNEGQALFPLGCPDSYIRSQLLYTASELGTAGNITSIGFYVNNLNNPAASTPVVIKMKNTRNSELVASDYASSSAGATTVYSGNILNTQLSVDNWAMITLNTPFGYTGKSLEVFVEINNAQQLESFNAKQFRNSETLISAFQAWPGTPRPGAKGNVSSGRPNIRIVQSPPSPMSFASLTTAQELKATFPGTGNQKLMSIKVETNGFLNSISASNFTINTNGLVSSQGIISRSRLYFTGSNPVFDTSMQFGAEITSPPAGFSFNGNQILEPGINYFWLTCDVSSSAVPGDSIDAECTQVTIGGNTYAPALVSPKGALVIGRLYDFESMNNSGFNAFSLNASANEWEKGIPATGPAGAFSGSQCWGTDLDGDYENGADYVLNSPAFIAYRSNAAISFKQWYDFASGSNNIIPLFEYKVNSAAWQPLYTIDLFFGANSETKWEEKTFDILNKAGDTIQFRWHLTTFNNTAKAAGWYIDDVILFGGNTYNQKLVTSYAMQEPALTLQGTRACKIMSLNVETSGTDNPLAVASLLFNTSGTTDINDITSARLYYSGASQVFDSLIRFGNAVNNPSGSFSFNALQELLPGNNYFWLVYDVSSIAIQGNMLDAGLVQLTLSSTVVHTPVTGAPPAKITIGNVYTFDTTAAQGFYASSLNQNPNEWEKGTPTRGPVATYSGTQCWGTNLNGDFSRESDYVLYTPPFIARSNDVLVSYKQWFEFSMQNANVTAQFEYRVNRGKWDTLAFINNKTFANSANSWEDVPVRIRLNIQDTIQFRWHFAAPFNVNMWWLNPVAPGWFIDQFAYAGLTELNQTYHTCGTQNIRTIIPNNTPTQPVLKIPVEMLGSSNAQSMLSFDFSTNGTNQPADISAARVYYTGNSSNFDTSLQYGSTILNPYGMFSVNGNQLLGNGMNYFWLVYDINSTANINDSIDAELHRINTSSGSYIPDTVAPQGNIIIGELHTFDTTSSQGFIAFSLNPNPNQWERGIPARPAMPQDGPASAHSGITCWGTNLNGKIIRGADYVVQTPFYIATMSKINIQFYHWFEFFFMNTGINAAFEYRINSRNWNSLYQINNANERNSDNNWQRIATQLNTTPGDTVQFRWKLSSPTSLALPPPGWYFDDFLISGVSLFNQKFISATADQVKSGTESGARNQGILHITLNTAGYNNPLTATSFYFNTNGSVTSAIESARVFYTGSVNRFDTLTPFNTPLPAPNGSFLLTGNQELQSGANHFWLTYNVAPNAAFGDSLDAELTDVGVSSAFYTLANPAPQGSIPVGQIYTFDTTSLQQFITTTLNTLPSQWQKGTPLAGPSSAYSGNQCWGTNLSGNFDNEVEYVLTTPSFITQTELVVLSYKQWFDFFTTNNGVEAVFQYNLNASGWKDLLSVDNTQFFQSINWQHVPAELRTTPGDIVQFRWRFSSSAFTRTAPGWYIDNFSIAGAAPFNQSFDSSTSSQAGYMTFAGSNQVPILKASIVVKGSTNPLTADALTFGTKAVTSAISSARLYYTGSNDVFDTLSPFGATIISPTGSMTFTDRIELNPGVNYFWLAYDVSTAASSTDSLDATFTQALISATPYAPLVSDPAGSILVGRRYDFEGPGDELFTTKSLRNQPGDWQRGVPTYGPPAAISGTQCWGTNLNANYVLNAEYVLQTPPYIASQAEVKIGYKNWYQLPASWFGWTGAAQFQYQKNNSGNWIILTDLSWGGNSFFWRSEDLSTAVTVGDTIQFRWYMLTDNQPSPGWYVDDFYVVGGQPIDASSPDIVNSRLSNDTSRFSRILPDYAFITDPSGVDTRNGNKPRIYFKKTSEDDVFGANNLTSNGWKYAEASNAASPFSFRLDYGLLTTPVSVNDTIEYFVAAQDLNVPSNTGANPPAGFNASYIASIISAPSKPDYFIITAAPMSGNYNVGGGQTYATLSAAVKDVNLRGISGPVTLTLTDAAYNTSTGETFPITFYPVSGSSMVNTVTVKPAVANQVTLSSNNAVFKLQGADHIIINGSNSGTSSQNMVLNGTGSTAVVWLCANDYTDGAQHNTIKNCMIRGIQSTKFGIYSGSSLYTVFKGNASAPSSFNVFDNNTISKVVYGIYMTGSSKAQPDAGNKITGNHIGDDTSSVSISGIHVSYQTADTIAFNKVQNIDFAFPSVYEDAGGILADNCNHSYINANKIWNFKVTNGSAYLYGILADGSEGGFAGPVPVTNNIVVNNFVSRGYSTSPNSYSVMGIAVLRGKEDKVYYNTVSLTGNLMNLDGSSATAFHTGDMHMSGIDVRNNIFHINGSSNARMDFFCIRANLNVGGSGSTFDHNLLSCTASGNANAYIGEDDKGRAPLLADWQSMTGLDANSKSANVTFVSAIDLHLAGSSIGDSLNLSGTPIAGFTTDIDGQTRHTTPYMGADENTATPLPVELLEFAAAADRNDVLLNWATASENNNKGFVVERSLDNKLFAEAGFVKGKNNKVKTSYRFNDVQALASAPVLYYRLKQVDNNGTYAYSRSVRVSRNDIKQGSNMVTYPNPFVKDVFVQFESNDASLIKVTLTDLTGRVVAVSEHLTTTGKNNIQVISNEALQAGVYFLTIESNNGKETIKLIKQ